jgi:aryl-alcohol dehydrogenase-like predicted oxidoreductase
MKHVSLGGLDVSRIGLGAMTMAGFYTTGAGLDDAESIRTIHRALDLGVTHIDTAEIYGPFHSEEVVGQAIKGRRDQVGGGDEVRPLLALWWRPQSHRQQPGKRPRRS